MPINDNDLGCWERSSHDLYCCLLLPCDIHPLMFVLQKSSLGDVLYQRVFYHLDLLETSYFGLQYTDASNVNVSLTYWVRLGSGDLM